MVPDEACMAPCWHTSVSGRSVAAPAYQRVREILKSGLDDAQAGLIAPQAALERAQQEMERALRAWIQGR